MAKKKSDTPPVENKKVKTPDYVPPVITGADVMANYRHQSEIFRQRRLKKLALKHPEIADLLRSKVKTPTAEAPLIES